MMMKQNAVFVRRSPRLVTFGVTCAVAFGVLAGCSSGSGAPGALRSSSLVAHATPSTAREALDLAHGITCGYDSRVPALSDLLGRNAEDPVFASGFLTELGGSRLLRLATITAQGDANGVAGLQRNLGRVLARGTQKPGEQHQVSAAWVKDLMDQGRERWTFCADPTVEQWAAHGRPALENANYQVYGYQALGILLRTGTYSSTFLTPIARDMLAAERHGGNGMEAWPRQAWDRTGVPLAPGGKDDTWDPIAGLLTAVSRDAHITQAFFTAETTGKEGTVSERFPRVDYLVTDREWGKEGTGLEALGHALSVATPVTAEDAAHAVLYSIVTEVALDEGACNEAFKKEGVLRPALRPVLARIFVTRFYSILSSLSGYDFRKESDTDVALDDKATEAFLSEVGKDPTARAALLQETYNQALSLFESAYKNKRKDGMNARLSMNSMASISVVAALNRSVTVKEGKDLTEDEDLGGTDLNVIRDWASAFLNAKDVTSGASVLDRLAAEYHRQGDDLVEYLARQRPTNNFTAVEAILKSVFMYQLPTADLMDAGVIDRKTGQILPSSLWPKHSTGRWKKSFIDRPDGDAEWAALRKMRWSLRINQMVILSDGPTVEFFDVKRECK
jgi:hypothetical protein